MVNPSAMNMAITGRRRPRQPGKDQLSGAWRVLFPFWLLVLAGLPVGQAAENGGPDARAAAYVDAIRQAHRALAAGKREDAAALLSSQVPQNNEADLRSFEWGYLWRQCRGQDTAAGANTNKVADAATGLIQRSFDSPLVFLADSRAFVGARVAGTDAALYDAESLEMIAELSGVNTPLHLCNDSHTMMMSGYSGLQFWDTRVRILAPVWFFPRDGDWSLSAFTPDGLIAAVRARASPSQPRTVAERREVVHHIQVLDVAERQELTVFTGHTGSVRTLAIASDGRTLASAGTDRAIRLWDLKQRQPLKNLTQHTGAVFSVTFSPDARWLASGGQDKVVLLWNVAAPNNPQRLEGHQQPIQALAYSPEGRTLASGSAEGEVKLWNLSSGRELVSLTGTPSANSPNDGVTRLSFSPDGRVLLARQYDGRLRAWRATATPATRTPSVP